ncbi:MAG TPA: tRNA (adenosine(37)-N6)-threonylcarbamoyltransferase complex transferase subunit TsaD [Lacipirellulaceae bacterium]
MNLLTIETTCDETAAAVVTDRLEVLASVVASQDALHERFSGVVPEIASRAHVERILPVIDETLRKASLRLADLDAVAVANTPGLAGSLLVGLTAAKALCLACNLPLVAVNHLQAHIYACRFVKKGSGTFCAKHPPGRSGKRFLTPFSAAADVFPCVGLIVSGGHSNLYRCESAIDFTPMGGTIDDAAGEAFDKVASLLGLPYPGGPSIERAARGGNPHKHRFPRPLLDDPSRLDFSFSGLKTAVRYLVAGPGKLREGSTEPRAESREQGADSRTSPAPRSVADIAASFQEAVIDCLVGKAELALEKTGFSTLCVGGGVAANRRFRDRLEESSAAHGYELFVPPLELCTDNAVMGAIALERLKAGKVEDLSLDIRPGPERASTQ